MKIRNLVLATLATILSGCATIPQTEKPAIASCEGVSIAASENNLLQTLIPSFAKTMGCSVGTNCLRTWDQRPNSEKISIAWAQTCGPVINGIPQLGDGGKGSTFVCEKKNQKTCCYPLGYEYIPSFVICN